MPVILSIHDATAESLDQVKEIAGRFLQAGGRSADILVVCGSSWSPHQIDELRRLSDQGFRLQGHGWTHRAGTHRTWFHHLHSWVLSRDVAEHLSKSAAELREIILRCAEWFGRHRLPPPCLYVPPAWALGGIGREELAALPFRYYETLGGIFDVQCDKYHALPLWGFEADTWLRAGFLRCFNRFNAWSAERHRRPLRVSVHPADPQLYLRRQLARALDAAANQGCCDLQSVCGGGDRPDSQVCGESNRGYSREDSRASRSASAAASSQLDPVDR